MTKTQNTPPIDEAFTERYREIMRTWQAGDLKAGEAESQLKAMLEEAEADENAFNQASIELNLGILYGYIGDLIASARLFQTAKQNYQVAGSDAQAVTCELNIGEVYRLQGNFTRAQMFFRRAYEKSKTLDNPRTTVVALTNEGQMWLSMNSASKAKETLLKAYEIAKNPYSDEDSDRIRDARYGVLAEICHALTQIYLIEENTQQAWDYAVQSYDYGEKSSQPMHLGFANRAIADAITALGQSPDEAFDSDPDKYYKVALKNFQKIKLEGDVAKTYLARGISLLKRGRKSSAAQLFQRAMAIFTKLGMTADAAQAAEAQMTAIG